jgi:site-specific DNA recombinase
MKRAAIYARVSTEEQAERGWSLSSQVEACQKFAEQRGLSIAGIFQDDISGATPIQERPEGRRLQKMVNNREIDTVIVYQVDRLSRRLGDLIYTVEDWLRNRLDIFSLDTGQIKSENDIVLVIRGWQGTDERAKIRERTMRGKREKAKNGKIVMIGHPPFGYLRNGRGDEARLIIEEREAATVRKIFHWYIIGDGINGPLSLRAIAERLDNEGDPTPHYRSNAAERWIPATVRGILVNEIYAGRTYYEKTRIIDPGKHLREKVSPENWIPINAPELAIIDRPLFEAVQDRARRNQAQASRNQKREYLMTGHFRCGACNSAMAGSASRPNGYLTVYYRCGNHFREEKCPNAGKTIVTSRLTRLYGIGLNIFSRMTRRLLTVFERCASDPKQRLNQGGRGSRTWKSLSNRERPKLGGSLLNWAIPMKRPLLMQSRAR